MKKLINTFILIISISILTSCGDKFDFSTSNLSTDFEQNSEFAIPLVDASIILEEILPDDSTLNKYLVIDNNKFIRLINEYDLASYPADDFFDGNYSGNNLPFIEYKLNSQIIDIGLNKFINQGEFYLADPKITISIKNYWNVATRFKFAKFFYFEEANSAGKPVTGPILNDWVYVNLPISPEEFAYTNIKLNNNNSNIADVISAMPHHFSFGANFETIPGGAYNINPGSVDSVKVKIDIPLDLRVTDLILRDTEDFNLGSELGNDTAKVQSLLLNFVIQNGFPISIDAQLYFADANYRILDSISTAGISIPSATVDAEGKVNQSTESLNTINIENQKKANLFKSKYIIPKIKFNTANSNTMQAVKLYSTYTVGLKIGARIKFQLKSTN